ncbi:MAG: hypothetical protein AB2604_01590 [Candidatus Thiodiazotropha taylori]
MSANENRASHQRYNLEFDIKDDLVYSMTEQTKTKSYYLRIKDKKALKGKPIAWLLIEREEHYVYDADNSVRTASLRLSYQRITHTLQQRGYRPSPFTANFEHDGYSGQCVDLTGGGVFMDLPGLKGQRIGTYLMNQIVLWVEQWPDAVVKPITLFASDVKTDEARDRRNRFYEQFDLEFNYEDPTENRSGVSKPMVVNELKSVSYWDENIKEYSLNAFAYVMIEKTDTLEHAVSSLKETQNWMETHPFQAMWWQLRSFFAR